MFPVKITLNLPQLYTLSIENIKEKIEFYREIGIEDIVLTNTKQLIQSIDLSYARYKFYESIGLTIDMTNYQKLFIGQKHFQQIYKLSNQELKELYSYSEYLEKTKIYIRKK